MNSTFRSGIVLALVVFSLVLSGCTYLAQSTDPERSEQVKGIDKHSSYPAVRRETYEKVNLIELIDPKLQASVEFPEQWNDAANRRDYSDQWGQKYDLVLSWFRQTDTISDAEKRRRRNGIQERILSVSVSRCNVFKTFLRRDQANQNFILGSLTTISGILGAVLDGVNSSRNLAGAAGIFSGIRSEYNQAYYSNLAAHVIVKGIETRQEMVYRRIQVEGQSKTIDDYPLDAAIKDAIYFDGLCSVVTGLDQAAASVDATLEPGIDAATRTMLRARLAREALDLPREELLKPETLERIGLAGQRLGMALVGSARGESVPASSEVDLFIAAENMVKQSIAAGDTVAASVEKAATARRAELIKELKDGKKLTADAEKKYEDAGKKLQAASAVKALLKSKIYDPLKLDVCYLKHAAPAVKARLDAVKARQDATEPEAKVKAEFAVKNASRTVQGAHEQLARIQQLINLDLGAYEKERLDAIKKIKTVDDLLDAGKIAGSATLKSAAGEACS